MWTCETWSKILNWLRKVRMNRQRKRTWRTVHYVKLELEGLTERIVPANVACTFTGAVSSAWDNPANWAPNGANPIPDDTGSDTATIAAGAICVLDQTDEVKIAGLTVAGGLTVKSQINVHAGGSLPGGNGDTGVTSTGLLDVTAPDSPGVTALLDTDTLSTVASAATNLSIDDGGELDVDFSGVLRGVTSVTGLLKAKTIDAFSGAPISLGGVGTISGPGQLEAEVNARMTFIVSSAWTILPGSPVGGALKDGNFFVDGPLIVTATTLDPGGTITLDPGGSIAGSGGLDEWGEFNWLGGSLGLTGGTTLEPTSEFKTDGADVKSLAVGTITSIAQSVNLGGTGFLSIGDGGRATFDNEAGIVDLTLPSISIGDAGLLLNSANGFLNAKDTTTIFGNFTNLGTLEVESGSTLTVDNPGPGGGGMVDLDGRLQLDGDLILLDVITSSSGFVEEAGGGTLKIGDPTRSITGLLTLASGSSTAISGNMEVTSIGTLTGAGFLNNSGLLKLDLGSTATIGSCQQSSAGTLDEHASGNGVNSSLSVSGDAQLSGTLTMDFDDGYTPASGDTFTVLTAGAIDAHFDTTPDNMTVTYGPTGVTATEN